MMVNCNLCKTEIINGKCKGCITYESDKLPAFFDYMQRTLKGYDIYCELNNVDQMFSSELQGNCLVIFKGTVADLDHISRYIKKYYRQLGE